MMLKFIGYKSEEEEMSANLIDALRRLMRDRGWNQEQLAENLGVAKSTVTYWLQGGIPEDRILEKINAITNGAIDVDGIRARRFFQNMVNQARRAGLNPERYYSFVG